MNKIKGLTLSLLFLSMSGMLYSAQINANQALEKAQQFYKQKEASLLRSAPAFQLIYSCKDSLSALRSANSSTYFYIYNIGNSQGFVIVSGDDATKSILGYSDEGSFSVENMPDNLKGWLDFYKSEIKYVTENGLNTTLLDSAASVRLRSTSSVEPLLGNIKWDQGDPYNLLCPKSSGKQAVTGCVATAMAQIMRYHQWPATGTGSHSYTSTTYGGLSANFGATNFDWANMSATYNASSTGAQDTAVARLMYHCGVSVDMNYNTIENGGSSASTRNVGTSLMNYFGYDPDIQTHIRSLHTAFEWENIIKSELNELRPVLYSGRNDTYGHAFVCDGYDSNNLFHINWGWSGLNNGYYELSSLYPSLAGTEGFSQGQYILTGIKKPDQITNTTYELGTWDKGLTPSAATISNISTGTFNVSFSILNQGLNLFSGKIGLGLFKNDIFQKELISNTISLKAYTGYTDYSLKGISLSGLTPGNYQIYFIYKASNELSWSKISSTISTNNYLDVVISGTGTYSASIQIPSVAPNLLLTKAIEQTGNVYQNRTATFSVTVQNTGREFYSNLGIKLVSTTNPLVSQIVKSGIVCLPAGETKTFNFTGDITCATGTYYAIAVYDSTNNSATNFKEIGPVSYNQLPVTISAEPVAAIWSLTEKISMLNTNVYSNNTISLNASIKNAGGYSASEIIAFVFPMQGGNSLGYLNSQTISIETNETQSVTLTGELNLDPGNYFFGLYYLENNSWTSFTPMSSGQLGFTLTNPTTGLEVKNSPDISIYPNPVKDQLNIQTSESVRQVQVSDLSGRVILSVRDTKSVQVDQLHSGVYFLHVETENGIKTVKFIKD